MATKPKDNADRGCERCGKVGFKTLHTVTFSQSGTWRVCKPCVERLREHHANLRRQGRYD